MTSRFELCVYAKLYTCFLNIIILHIIRFHVRLYRLCRLIIAADVQSSLNLNARDEWKKKKKLGASLL